MHFGENSVAILGGVGGFASAPRRQEEYGKATLIPTCHEVCHPLAAHLCLPSRFGEGTSCRHRQEHAGTPHDIDPFTRRFHDTL